MVTQENMVVYATTQIITDATPVGLGIILTQQQENGEHKTSCLWFIIIN